MHTFQEKGNARAEANQTNGYESGIASVLGGVFGIELISALFLILF